MEKSMSFKLQAVEKAVDAYEQIKEAFSRPDKAISGEVLSLYEELADWGFFDKYKIADLENRWIYVTAIAMIISLKAKIPLVLNKEEKGKGKWEIIQLALEESKKSGKSGVNKKKAQ